MVRALEAVLAAGGHLDPAARDRLWRPGTRYAHRLFALEPDRALLAQRISTRVEAMVAAGLLEEVSAVLAAGPVSRTLAQAIGLRELAAWRTGELTLEEALARMAARTRAFARRQLTWMRKLPDAARLPVAGRDPAAVAEDLLARLRD